MRLEKELETSKESEMFGRFVGATVAQNNYYVANPDEMYFMARHDVLAGLTDQIIDYYHLNKGTNDGLDDRDKTYMRFVQWMKSDEFAMHIGSKYIFRQPYIVGSSWTPIRRDGGAVDVIVGVRRSDEETITEVPQEALDIFIRAFCRRFANDVDDEVLVRNNTLFSGIDDFRMTIRLAVVNNPPFAVRVTSAISQYDDFCENFSALAFFLHDWFKHIRASGKGTEQLAAPSSQTVTYLLIHFLQYYEQVPQFFNHSFTSNGTYLLSYTYDDIVQYSLPAYHPNLYQSYQAFSKLRRDRPASIGELLIMFFFHYGHLIDLPHVELSVNIGTVTKKYKNDCIRLVMLDEDGYMNTGVPDAYRLQFLMRDAFQLIKDSQNPAMVIDRLMRMRVDEAFNAMRDRLMKADPIQNEILEMATQNVTEYAEDTKNHKKISSQEGFSVTKCGETTFYKRISKATTKNKGYKDAEIPLFSDEHHAMKSYLQRPFAYRTGGKTPSMDELVHRACKMFITMCLPNPNNLSQINVIFRPPISLASRFRILEDPFLEPYIPEYKPVESKMSFIQLAKAACYKEIKGISEIRHRCHLPVKSKTKTSLIDSAPATPSKKTTPDDETGSPAVPPRSGPSSSTPGISPALMDALTVATLQFTAEELNLIMSYISQPANGTKNDSTSLLAKIEAMSLTSPNTSPDCTPKKETVETQHVGPFAYAYSKKSTGFYKDAPIDMKKLMEGLAPGDFAGLRCKIGGVIFKSYKESVDAIRESWLEEMFSKIQPDVEYSGLNDFD